MTANYIICCLPLSPSNPKTKNNYDPIIMTQEANKCGGKLAVSPQKTICCNSEGVNKYPVFINFNHCQLGLGEQCN
jgi:hypothetical protein